MPVSKEMAEAMKLFGLKESDLGPAVSVTWDQLEKGVVLSVEEDKITVGDWLESVDDRGYEGAED